MPELYRTQPIGQTPFVVTSYRSDANGSLKPDVPARCPLAATSIRPEPCCRITNDHERIRKTGPGHPLQVVRCHAHGIAFTLYPPGFAPYRRQSVAVVGPDGAQVGTDESSVLNAGFGGTLFDAALDASQGIAWARESGCELPDRWWSTQGRHLELAARIVGIACGLAGRTRETIASILALDTLTILERHQEAGGEDQGYRALGKAIGSILGRLRGVTFAAVALLRCGYWIGQWGEPLHWDAKRRLYDRGPFQV